MDNNITENMPDLGELISKLTSDPAMMQQISQIAESFKSSAPPQDTDEAVETMARRPHQSNPHNKNQKSHHNSVDNHTQLFKALKPYLNNERKETLEYIMQLFNIIKLLEMSGLNIGSLIPAFNTQQGKTETDSETEEGD